jgi:hypothetical protein
MLGYHSNVVLATGKQSSSAKTRHANLMEYNDRLNQRQAGKHGLTSPDLRDFYEISIIENINTMRLSMGMEPIYKDTSSVFDYADTGERSGFHNNFLNSSDGDSFELLDPPSTEKSLPVRTKDEIKKFNHELSQHLPNKPNFDHWAIKWNICIDSMKRFGGEMLDIAPKKAYHLKKYYDVLMARGNKNNSLAKFQDKINHLQGTLRSPDIGDHPALHTTESLKRNSKFADLVHPSPNVPNSSGISNYQLVTYHY